MIKLNLSQINKDYIKSTYVGKVAFSDLEKIARLSAREISGGGEEHFFQRPTDKNKINKIVHFIEKNIFENSSKRIKKNVDMLSLFPTAMILSINSNYQNGIDFDEDSNILYIDPSILSLDNRPMFIVDGQHRFVGVKNFYDKHPDILRKFNIEFPVTVLLGYDMYEQANIFANVNFQQKPVNKSLYYDIFGSLPYEKNKITLAHYIVKHLNDDNDSPLNKMVKMLGVGEGIVSQAFLVEKIIDLFGSKNIFREQFINYRDGGDDYKKVYKIIYNYFSSLKDEFANNWPIKDDKEKYSSYKYKDVMMKTAGVGALFKFFSYLGNDVFNADTDYFKKIYRMIKKVDSKNGGKNLFGSESIFAGAGSAGLQEDLFKELKFRYEFMNFLTKKYKEEEIIDARRIKLNGRFLSEVHLTNGTGQRPSDQEISDKPFMENDEIRAFDI